MAERLNSALWGQTAPFKRIRIIMAAELTGQSTPNSGITSFTLLKAD